MTRTVCKHNCLIIPECLECEEEARLKMKKVVIVEIERYRDADDVPVCAYDFKTGKVCRFLLSMHFGTKHVCALHDMQRVFSEERLGYLRPCKECEVWRDYDAQK